MNNLLMRFSIINLLTRTLSVINKKEKKKFYSLAFIVIIQALLDIINLASIIPLIEVLTNKDNLREYIKNIYNYIGIDQLRIINDNNFSLYIPLIVIFIMLISTISRLYVVYRTNKFIEDIRHDISSRLMNQFINKNLEKNINNSKAAKSILSEVDQFIIIVFQPTMLMLTNLILLFSIILFLFLTNLTASILSTISLLIFYFNFYIFSKRKLNKEGAKSEQANKGRFKTAIEIFSSIKDIKIYKSEIFFSKRFQKYSRIFSNTNAIYSTLIASPKYILETLVFIGLAFSILIFSLLDLDNLSILPLLGTFAFAAYKAQPALSNIIYGINSLEFGSKIIKNLFYELNRKDFQTKTNISIKNSSKKYLIKKHQSNGIIIKNMRYLFKNNKGLLDINLFVKHPSFFVIAGESGSGKSTLLNIISKIKIPQSGEIIYNLPNSSNNPPIISFLHQEHSLYDASIAENIAYGIEKNEINKELLKNVLKSSGIYDYVYSLKNNIYEKVGENGSNLSVGQKQRIALARALYFKPDILLLDEPTSGLDIYNEKKIINTLIKISKNITIIMSTHKLNYISNNICIGYIKNGRIEIKDNNN